MMTSIKIYAWVLTAVVVGCGKIEQQSINATDDAKAVLPVVTDGRTDLVLSWFVDGGAEVGASVADVPKAARKEVRVQDPNTPPEKSDPDTIYLADLTAPKTGGRYLVKAVKRSVFEAERRAKEDKAEKERQAALAAQQAKAAGGKLPDAVIPPGTVPVVMYATKHCPVCVQARRWLLDQKIPYVEKDIEADQAAAAALQQKGAAQGVSVRGVPIFEVYGRLIPGFDPGQIVSLLNQGAKPQQTQTI